MVLYIIIHSPIYGFCLLHSSMLCREREDLLRAVKIVIYYFASTWREAESSVGIVVALLLEDSILKTRDFNYRNLIERVWLV